MIQSKIMIPVSVIVPAIVPSFLESAIADVIVKAKTLKKFRIYNNSHVDI